MGPTDLATSSDQQHIYLTSREDGSIVHLTRFNGLLHWAESLPLGAFSALAMSPDESFLYASSKDSLVVLKRNLTDGRLSATEHSYKGAQGLAAGPLALAAAVDGKLTIYNYGDASSDGALSLRGSAGGAELKGVERINFSPNGEFVFAAGFGADTVSSWALTKSGAQLVGKVSNMPGLDNPNDVVVSPDGTRLFVAGFCDNSIAIVGVDSESGELTWLNSFGNNDDGELGDCKSIVRIRPNEDEPLEGEEDGDFDYQQPASIDISADGKTLAVYFWSVGVEVVYYSVQDDQLKFEDYVDQQAEFDDFSNQAFHLEPSDEPHPFGANPKDYRDAVRLRFVGGKLYFLSRFANALGVANGAQVEQIVQRGDGGVGSIAGAYNLGLSGDDKHLYVAPRTHDTVGSFAIDSQSGALTEIPAPVLPVPPYIDGAITNVTVSPDGTQVLGVDAAAGSIQIYDRNLKSGALTFREFVELPFCDGGFPFPLDVAIPSDGRTVYIADFQMETKSCIVAYPRDEEGRLGEPVLYKDSFLEGIESFNFTQDGKHVYVACLTAGAIAHYTRDPATGQLTAMTPNTSQALSGVEFAVLSPDEKWVYASSPPSDRFIVLSRNVETGVLTEEQVFDVNDVPLRGAAGIAVTPDGKVVYVASRVDEAVNIFNVDNKGKLTLGGTIQGLPGLFWVNGLKVTSDGKYLFTSAVGSSSVSSFKIVRGNDNGCGASCP
ncbi:MAG TPA: hypothetical protein EYN06_00250 [Myxococcales bacterium]|nr:hypothetical protein [Myxococcales bacterium]